MLCAAETEQFSVVEGRVVDNLTSVPIVGARVILVRTDKPGTQFGLGVYDAKFAVTGEDRAPARMEVVTGDDGVFHFEIEGAAKFALFTDAPGYVRPVGISSKDIFEATPSRPKLQLILKLIRKLSVSGRVIDNDTGKPVRGFVVAPHRYVSTGAGNSLGHANSPDAMTDVNGNFTIDSLPADQYYFQARPAVHPKIEEARTDDDFRNTVHTAYIPTWYPGVDSEEEAFPLQLIDGATLDNIEIKVTKRRTASIRGRVLAPDMNESGETAEVVVTRSRREIGAVSVQTIAQGTVRIGAAFQIDGISAGIYTVYAHANTPQSLFAITTLQIGDNNHDGLALELTPGLKLAGHMSIDGRDKESKESELPTGDALVILSPVIRMALDVDPPPAAVNGKDGSFTLRGVLPGKYYVRVATSLPGYLASEVQCDHRIALGRVVQIENEGCKQQFDIRLARASGSIMVAATDGKKPTSGADILVLPEQVDQDAVDLPFELQHFSADENGKATITGLLPAIP